MKGKSPTVYIYILVAMMFWGMSFVWTSVLLRYYQPVAIIFIRLVISSIFLFGIILLFRKNLRIRKKDYLMVFVSSVFNPFLYFIGENTGLKHSTSTITAVIISTIPVFSPLVARITINERLTWFNIAGILLAFCGIIIMLVNPGMNSGVTAKGAFFLCIAVIAALIYSVLLKKLTVNNSPLTLIAYQNLIGIFLFMPFFFFVEYPHFIKVIPDLNIVSSFLYLGILASSISYVLFARSVKSIGISRTNIFTNLIPVFTAIFSFFILAESFTFLKIMGMLIVIAGVVITQNSPKPVNL